MSKIVVDQFQKSGGAAFTLPTSDGTNGQFMKTDGAGNLVFGAGPVVDVISGLVAPESKGNIGCIISHTDRSNTYSTGEWSSSGPWTTYTANQSHTDNHLIQFISMALGDGYGNSGTSELAHFGDFEGGLSRQLQFSNGNRLGYSRDVFHYDNNTSYGGHSFRIMPIRNTSGAAITISLAAYCSDYWSAGYEGAQLFVLAPNSGLYSGVTGVTGTSLASSSTTTQNTNLTGTFSVPANTTILACLVSTDQYQTTYRFKDTNFFYNLNTTFTNASIICDMRMLSSLFQSRFSMTYAGAASSIIKKIWTDTALNYGDR
jgi:hypothetical protein